jgi:hypothetical protein
MKNARNILGIAVGLAGMLLIGCAGCTSSGAKGTGGAGGGALGGATSTASSSRDTGAAGTNGHGTGGGDSGSNATGGTVSVSTGGQATGGDTASVSTGGYATGGGTMQRTSSSGGSALGGDSGTGGVSAPGGSTSRGGSGGAGGTTSLGTGGYGTGGAGGTATGGSGGGGSSGVSCPAGLPAGPPWQFCVDSMLYEGTGASCDGGACACVSGRHLYCLEGCVKNPNDAGGSCKTGLVQCPSSGYYKPICFGNALHNLATACPAGGSCTCILMLKERCTNRCTDLSDGSGQCE